MMRSEAALASLAREVTANGKAERILAVLDIRAYGDESESPTHLVLTCAFAPWRHWLGFQWDWNRLLARENYLTEFHAHDCVQGDGEFKHLDNTYRQQLYREFAEVIQEHRLHAAAIVVEVAAMPTIGQAFGPPLDKAWVCAFAHLVPRKPPRTTRCTVFSCTPKARATSRRLAKPLETTLIMATRSATRSPSSHTCNAIAPLITAQRPSLRSRVSRALMTAPGSRRVQRRLRRSLRKDGSESSANRQESNLLRKWALR